jgi:hypothetical protein
VPAPAAPAAAAPSSAQSAFTTAALSVLGAIGTGIGVLGFLTFVGAATWVARFRGVELSGTYAISAMPRSELIATGADQIFAPAIAALLAAAVVLGLLALAHWRRLDVAEWTGVVLAFVALGAAALAWHFQHNVGSPFGHDTWVPFLGVVASFALGAGLVVVLARRAYVPGEPTSPSGALALAAAVAGTLLVYGALETYALNMMRPHIRPAAVVAPDGTGWAGYYVGQDADTVYLGVTAPPLDHTTGDRSAARIVQIPLTEGSRIAVGSTLAPFKARELAHDLLDDLREHDGT